MVSLTSMFQRKTQATLVLLPDGSMELYTGKIRARAVKEEYPNYYLTADADQSTPLPLDTLLQPGGTYYLNESVEASSPSGAPTAAKESTAEQAAAEKAEAAEAAPKQAEVEFEGVDDDLLSYLTLNDTSGPAADSPAAQNHRRSLDSRVTKFGGTEDYSASATNSPGFGSFRGSPTSAVTSPAPVASSRRRSMGDYPAGLSPVLGAAAPPHLSGGGGGDVFGGSGPFTRGASSLSKTMHAAGPNAAGSAAMMMASRAVGGDVLGQHGSSLSPATHLEWRGSVSSGSAGSSGSSGSAGSPGATVRTGSTGSGSGPRASMMVW